MITIQSIWTQWVDLKTNNIFFTANGSAPINGVTGVDICGPGSTLTDYSSSRVFVNTGTISVPVWEQLSINNNAIRGNGPIAFGKAQYDFSADGGAVGLITPASNCIIPDNAIILGGIIDILTTFTSGGSATIAVGTSAGSSTSSLKGATAVGSWSAGLLAVVPVFTAATMVKLSAQGQVTLTVAVADLTAGKANIILAYLVSN